MMKKIEVQDTLIKQLMGVGKGPDDVMKINESTLSNAGKEITSLNIFLGGQESSFIKLFEIILQVLQNTHDKNVETFIKLSWLHNCFHHLSEIISNTTIEERVALLEIQVADIEGQITDLDEDVDFLFDEQVIQDERLFTLEQTTNDINADLVAVDEELESEC